MNNLSLQFIKRSDPRYQIIRDRHYIPNRGTHGQQLHYLIYEGECVIGIISGASAVYGCAPRDKFFKLSKEQRIKQSQLNGIINNTVFRLEVRQKNLATMILSMWRKQIAKDWEHLYGVKVGGFETFVIKESRGGNDDRHGGLYKADNWEHVGITKGNTKTHDKSNNNGGLNTSHKRRKVEPKLIYCYRIKRHKKPVPLPEVYISSWKDKKLAKQRSDRRKKMFNQTGNQK